MRKISFGGPSRYVWSLPHMRPKRNYRLLDLGGVALQFRTGLDVDFSELIASYPYAMYIDSFDPACVLQVHKWFAHGFFSPKDTVVLFRSRLQSCAAFLEFFSKREIPFVGFDWFKDLRLEKTQVVFYPFNTNTNPIVMKKREPLHVFIGHGESDKWASINPMFRMYDHIFCAGQCAVDRLLGARIVNSQDIADGRCVKVGLPYVGEEPSKLGLQQAVSRRGVIYAPTWEGVEVRQRYCSLEDGFGERIVETLLASTDEDVLFRPHPSTGRKRGEIKAALQRLVNRFASHDRFVLVGSASALCIRDLGRSLRRLKRPLLEPLDADLMGRRLMVTDISSMIAAAVFYGCPFALIAKVDGDPELEVLGDPRRSPLASLAEVTIEWPRVDQLERLRPLMDEAEALAAAARIAERRSYVVEREADDPTPLPNRRYFERVLGRLGRPGRYAS